MKILVTGSTGLVGKALVAALAKNGHSVCRLVRPGTNVTMTQVDLNVAWNPATGELGGAAVGADAVVNLAEHRSRRGDGRKRERRVAVESSRYDPGVDRSAGKDECETDGADFGVGVGYYGNRGDETLDEESAGVKASWRELRKSGKQRRRERSWRTRVVLARFGNYSRERGRRAAENGNAVQIRTGRTLGSGKQWIRGLPGRCGGDIEIVSGADADSSAVKFCSQFLGR